MWAGVAAGSRPRARPVRGQGAHTPVRMPNHRAPPRARGFRSTLRSRGGFSMIELMTVLVIIGIMASIAAPRLDISHYRVDSAMQSVGSALLAAQRAAVVKQHDVVVSFDTGGRMVRIHEDMDNDALVDTGEDVRFRPLDPGVAFGRGGAPGFRIGNGPVSFTRVQAGRPAVTFHRNGTASEEGGVYLTSTRAARSGGYAADARVIIVDRATGRPSWFNYTRLTWKRGF